MAELFKHGYRPGGGTKRGHRNVAHAVDNSEKFARLVSKSGASHKTVLRAMQRVDPAIGRVQLTVKPLPREDERLKRQRTAALLQRQPAIVRKATIMLDEASYGFGKLPCKVYGDTSKGETVVQANRVPRTRDQMQVLEFVVLLDYHNGPLDLVYVSGTKGLSAETHKVRTHLCSRQQLLEPLRPCLGGIAPLLKNARGVGYVGARPDKAQGGEHAAVVNGLLQLGTKVGCIKVGDPQHAATLFPRFAHFL
jgi:hypothetical protein